MKSSHLKGFTILELLVALSLFATLSVLAYGGLQRMLDIEAQTNQEMLQLAQWQKIFFLMNKDMNQLVNRSFRDEYGERQPALQISELGEYALAFIRAGVSNPLQHKRSHLQRIAYGVIDGQLVRTIWPHLDQPDNPQPISMILTNSVQSLSVRVLDENRQWISTWPSDGDLLPRALEITIEFDDHQHIRRLYPLVDTATIR